MNVEFTIHDGNLLHVSLPLHEQTVRIPEGVTVIQKAAFDSAGHVRELYLPDSLLRAERPALGSCPQLHAVSMPAGCLHLLTMLPPVHLTVRGQIICFPEDYTPQGLICPDTPIIDLPVHCRKTALQTFVLRSGDPARWQESVYQANETYAQAHALHLVAMARTERGLYPWLMAHDALKLTHMDAALADAEHAKDADLTAALMRYRHTHFTAGELRQHESDLMDSFDREMEALINPETDEHKQLLWRFSRDGTKVHNYRGSDKSITYPTSYRGKAVTGLADRSRLSSETIHYIDIEHITVPSGYTEIGTNAFLGCFHLKSLTLPATIRTMNACDPRHPYIKAEQVHIIQDPGHRPGGGTLQLPSGVEEIIVHEGVTRLPRMMEGVNEAFNQLHRLVLPLSLEGLDGFPALTDHNLLIKADRNHPCLYRTSEGCLLSRDRKIFYYAPNTLFGRYTVPRGVEIIMPYAFCNCQELTNVLLPDTLRRIYRHAFEGCRNLTRISLPAGFEAIGDMAFAYCTRLASINFPEGLVRIGTKAFHCCQSLLSALLPDSLNTLGESAFSYCKALSRVRLPQGMHSIPTGTFDTCTSLRRVSLPPQLEKIEGLAFNRAYKLQLELPASCTVIAATSFLDAYQCTLIAPAGSTVHEFARKYRLASETV